MPKLCLGIGWYSEEEWVMLKMLADDSEALDPTYEQWLAGAENALQQLRSRPDVKVVKVPVIVTELQQWCRDHGKKLNGEARAQFITEKVQEYSES